MSLSSAAKIIIVDDVAMMLTGLRRALTQLGFSDIIEAHDGAQAFAALEANTDTALIISDWNMEPMDGLALLHAVRADARFRDLPFILVSANAEIVRDTAAAAGASMVLAKPFDVNALRAAITAFSV